MKTLDFTRQHYYTETNTVKVNANRKRLTLECVFGKSDDVNVFRESEHIYVLSYNRRLEYIGLQCFDLESENCGEVFFQSPDELELPKSIFDYTEINMAKILSQYIN